MIELRRFTKADFPQMMRWATSAEFLMQWCGWTFTYPLDEPQLERYLRTSEGDHATRRLFSAVDSEMGKVVGHIGLSNLSPHTSSATISCVTVDASMRGKGVGEAIIRQVLDIAFRELGLHRVDLNVFDFNEPALALYEKFGFVREGLIREARQVGDAYWSHYHMGLLEHEWRARQ
jgi:RimJ/RimL family protein N-acetyltransferase